MGNGVSARERRRIELVERLRAIVDGSAVAIEDIEAMTGLLAGAGVGRVETYLFEGIVHDVRDTQGRLSEFLAMMEARLQDP
jgi:hypothetical protein